MIRHYTIDYNTFDAQASFKVDTEKFTVEHARATLEFFTWIYDKKADLIDEVLKKYGLEVIKQATFNDFNVSGVIAIFSDYEGFCPLDGSHGITLQTVSGYDFDEDLIDMDWVN